MLVSETLVETLSLPMGERGLKLCFLVESKATGTVAPYGGAWIETKVTRIYAALGMSLPMGERGLKHTDFPSIACPVKSLPMGERGLKPVPPPCCSNGSIVAPYGGAWIETYQIQPPSICCRVAPYGGAWIETQVPQGRN